MQNNGMSAEDATTYCEGGEVDGFSIADSINAGFASQMEEAGLIKNIVYGEWNDGIEEDYRNLKDSNGNQRGVFIKVKSDLSEKYVCTMYDGTKEDGFETETHCLLSDGAYNTRSETNSQWSQVKTLFEASNCSENSSFVRCHVSLPISNWACYAYSEYYLHCEHDIEVCRLDRVDNCNDTPYEG